MCEWSRARASCLSVTGKFVIESCRGLPLSASVFVNGIRIVCVYTTVAVQHRKSLTVLWRLRFNLILVQARNFMMDQAGRSTCLPSNNAFELHKNIAGTDSLGCHVARIEVAWARDDRCQRAHISVGLNVSRWQSLVTRSRLSDCVYGCWCVRVSISIIMKYNEIQLKTTFWKELCTRTPHWLISRFSCWTLFIVLSSAQTRGFY